MRKLQVEELGRVSQAEFQAVPKLPVVAVLDNIRSMHNVGSVFRTADAFRLARLYLCGITPRPPHREIRKTAIGAEETVVWEAHAYTKDVVIALKKAGYQILVVEQVKGSTSLPKFMPQSNTRYAVVLGHEIDGVSQTIVDMADEVLEIPQFGTKHSLNVSVAAGIVLYRLTAEIFQE